jgi:CTP synthase
VNNDYRRRLEDAGLLISGTSPDGSLVEVIELPGHPWFVGIQSHPEFLSKPTEPHPLFRDFIGASLAHRQGRKEEARGRQHARAV